MAVRNEPLGWLRGLLAASITIYHLVGWEIAQQDASSVLGRLGAYGVSMFFILSGLSIALVYHRFMADRSSALRFFVRRIFRIWPLMWIVVIIAAVTHAVQGDPVSWKLVAINLTTLFGFIRPTSYINTGAWAIGNEMVYYALTPFVIAVYNRGRRLGNVLTGATVLIGLLFSHVLLDAQVPIAEQWGTYVNPFNNLFLYCAGIALYYNADHLEPSRATCLAVLAVGVAVFIWHPVAGNFIQILTGWNRIVFCAASIAIVFGFYKHRGGLARIVALPLTQLGLAAYGVYLLHPVVWQACSQLFGLLHLESTPAAMIGATIAGTLVIAWVSYHCYELPLIRWGKRLTSLPLNPKSIAEQPARPVSVGN